MRKTIKRVVGVLMCMSMVFGCPVISSAEALNHEVSTNTTVGTTVTYTQSSAFQVVVAKTIVLNSNKTGSYTVNVTGDINATEEVTVIPQDTNDGVEGINITMSHQVPDGKQAKDDVLATITQTKSSWNYDEMGQDAQGTITANDLSAGDWSGTVNFQIGLQEKQ